MQILIISFLLLEIFLMLMAEALKKVLRSAFSDALQALDVLASEEQLALGKVDLKYIYTFYVTHVGVCM